MKLNTIKPAPGAKTPKLRVGRGIGSGLGKTAGRGHKGQRARSGGYHKVGFEGGQMPMQRRLPKRGFRSHLKKANAEVALSTLDKLVEKLGVADIDVAVLKAHNLVPAGVEKVKVIASGALTRAVALKGVHASAGARDAITAAGGSVSE